MEIFDRQQDAVGQGEKTLLVYVDLPNNRNLQNSESEFEILAKSSGLEIKKVIQIQRKTIDPQYFIGSGKNIENISKKIFNQTLRYFSVPHPNYIWSQNANDANVTVYVEESLDGAPDNNTRKAVGGKFKGQTQKWYIMRFLGEDNEINLNTKYPEFLEWKWINYENITDKVVEFKLHVYEKIKKELKKLI